MEGLRHVCESFIQRDDVPTGVLEALGRFVTSTPRRVMQPTKAHEYEELEERKLLGGRMMQALVEALPTMEETVTSVVWSLIMVAPVEQLRSFESSIPPSILVQILDLARTRLGILLKTFLTKEHAISGPHPYPSRNTTVVEKCLQRDGDCCVVTGGATPQVCHVIPYSVTRRKRVFTQAIGVVIGNFWGHERHSRLLALLSDEEIDSVRNTLCLSPLLHRWWGLGYMAIEPLEKLSNGTRVRFRWLRRTRFSVWDKVPLDTDPDDHLQPPPVPGSFAIRNFYSGHPILDGLVIDLTSGDPTTEVSYDLLQLQWDLLCMTVLCGAAEAADDLDWDPEDEDSVYAGEKLMRELELEDRRGPAAHG